MPVPQLPVENNMVSPRMSCSGCNSTENFKLLLIGNDGVGKTSCLLSHQELFPIESVPPSSTPSYSEQVHSFQNDIPVVLQIYDTPSAPESRIFAFCDVDVLLVCFDISVKESFTSIKSHWLPHIKKYSPKSTLVLVGMKGDLRKDPEKASSLVTVEAATELAASTMKSLIPYQEVSALDSASVRKLFQYCAKAGLDASKAKESGKKKTCVIL